MPGMKLSQINKAKRVYNLVVESPKLAEIYAPFMNQVLDDAILEIKKLRRDVSKLRGSGRVVTVRASQMAIKNRLWNTRLHLCARCNCELVWSIARPHHIVPVSEGGVDTDENLELLCSNCHLVEHSAALNWPSDEAVEAAFQLLQGEPAQ